MSNEENSASPYKGINPKSWAKITKTLLQDHPLATSDLVEVTLGAWNAIFESKIGPRGFTIGIHIYPKPQIMAFLLHELIPLELATKFPKEWRGDESADEKDLVCLSDNQFSIEVKTSSSPNGIYGNRSYAQQGSSHKKSKSGYLLAINFGKFSPTGKRPEPEIRQIRFGWLDQEDWIGQLAQTGQQARLTADAIQNKLMQLYEYKN